MDLSAFLEMADRNQVLTLSEYFTLKTSYTDYL